MAGKDRKEEGRLRALAREVGEIYRGIFHVYRAWWPDIILLSLIIFIPIGLLDAADSHALESIGPGHDFKVAALIAGALVVSATSLLGEVFLAGAVGLSLTHAEDGRPPSIGFIARRLNYPRLIAVDLLFVLLIAAGLLLLIVPGLMLFIYLALAGPVVEIEDRRIWASFKRSFRLVRGRFWLVAWVLFPIEILGESVQQGIEKICEATLGHSILALGLGEALAEVALSPLFAIAAVLLTRRLIAAKDGVDIPGPSPRQLRAGLPTP